MEVCPNKSTPKTKKKACKNQSLTSIRSWDDSSSEEEEEEDDDDDESSDDDQSSSSDLDEESIKLYQ